MIYLLDNNVLQYFFHARRELALVEAAAVVPMVIAGEVFEEACLGANGARARKVLTGSAIGVRQIEVDSPVDATLEALQPLASVHGDGERESIAIAAHDPELVFVANDRNAMWIALNELHLAGARMIGVPVLLRRLHEAGRLEPAAIDDVLRHWSGRRPTWWPTWRASVEPMDAIDR